MHAGFSWGRGRSQTLEINVKRCDIFIVPPTRFHGENTIPRGLMSRGMNVYAAKTLHRLSVIYVVILVQ